MVLRKKTKREVNNKSVLATTWYVYTRIPSQGKKKCEGGEFSSSVETLFDFP